MIDRDLLAAIVPVVDALEQLGVPYSLCGSIVSSAYGIARSTVDADLVADLKGQHVDTLVARLEKDYYIDGAVASDAVRRHAMFNVIHLATMMKVDIYVLTPRAFDRMSFSRRTERALPDQPNARMFQLDTAEDTVLHKLEWVRAKAADPQWSDIIGVLAVQGTALDRAYLDHWASELGVTDLLARAWRDA